MELRVGRWAPPFSPCGRRWRAIARRMRGSRRRRIVSTPLFAAASRRRYTYDLHSLDCAPRGAYPSSGRATRVHLLPQGEKGGARRPRCVNAVGISGGEGWGEGRGDCPLGSKLARPLILAFSPRAGRERGEGTLAISPPANS